MTKVPVYSLEGKQEGEVDLGEVFSNDLRLDLILKGFIAEQSVLRQPYGTDPLAGKRTSAHYHGRRAIKHSMMNREMARAKRIHGTGYLHMTARFVPQATKGRAAHPPKVERVWEKKINKKERLKALLSALSAVSNSSLVITRGHEASGFKHLPIVFDDKFEELKSTKKVLELFNLLGLSSELERTSEKKIRAGKGTMRGRKYKKKKGILIVVGEDRGIGKAARNIPGLDVSTSKNLNVSLLAPGGNPGRLTVFTKSALENVKKLNQKVSTEKPSKIKGKPTKEASK